MSIRFNEIEGTVKNSPGLYQIFTNLGIPLKVGIGAKLLKRLKDHRASYQSGLKLKKGGTVNPFENINPTSVLSKKSILAKHLFFDNEITKNYDLKTQTGRRAFLLNECYIKFEHTETKEEARELERQLEANGKFRYQGNVSIHPID